MLNHGVSDRHESMLEDMTSYTSKKAGWLIVCGERRGRTVFQRGILGLGL